MHFVADCSKQAVLENRFPDVKDPGEKLAKCLKQDNVDNAAKDWSPETSKRYISIGTSLAVQEVRDQMVLYEAMFKRNSHLDSISMLRAVAQVCSSTADIVYVVQTLFMEQLVGIRATMPVQGKRVQGHCFRLDARLAIITIILVQGGIPPAIMQRNTT